MISRKICILSLAFCFALASLPEASFAEDLYYLEKELQETQRKINPIADSIIKMEAFLEAYPKRRDDLKKVYDELNDLKDRLEDILQKNLIKSTIALGIETITKIQFASGLYGQTIVGLIKECGMEYVGDVLEDDASSPYNRSVKKLSSDASAILPELQKFQWMMSLTAGEWRGLMRTTGEFKDDEEKGMLYRRFQVTLEEIDKHKRRIEDLVRELDSAKNAIESQLPALYEQSETLVKKKGELQTRLIAATAEKKQQELDEAIGKAEKEAEKSKVPSFPPVAVTGKWEEDLKAWEAKFDAAETVIKTEVPKVLKEVENGRKKIKEDLDAAAERMKASMLSYGDPQAGGSYYRSYFSVPGEVSPTMAYQADFLVSEHARAKKSMEVYSKWGSAAGEARKEMSDIEASGVKLAVIEKKLTELVALARSIDDEFRAIAGAGSVNNTRNMLWLMMKLIPGYVNYNYNLTGLDYVAMASATDTDLANMEQLLPLAIEVDSKNERICEKMFSAKKRAAEEVSSRFNEAYTNMENAFKQMESTSIGYSKLIAGSKWASARNNAPSSEFYYSTMTGGLRPVITNVFSPERFGNDLGEAMKTGDMRSAKSVIKEYRDLFSRCDDLGRKYEAAWIHYYYYLDEIRQMDLSLLSQMHAASMVEGAILRAPALSAKDYDRIQGGDAKFAGCFSGIQELPTLELAPGSKGDKALRLYELAEKVEKEGPSWASLDSKSFFIKYDKVMEELEKAGENSGLDEAVFKIKSELSKIYDAWRKSHPVDTEEGKGEDDKDDDKDGEKPGFGNHNLINPRINTRSVEDASGTLVLLRDNLPEGFIEIAAKLDNITNVQKILVSSDDMAWTEMPLKADIVFPIYPVPDRFYRPVVRLKLSDGSEERLVVFPHLSGIVYRDMDMTRLVVESVQVLAEAYEARSLAKFMDVVSRDFIGNRVYLEEGVRFDFDMFTDIRLAIFINRIEKAANTFVAETKWDKTQMPRQTGSQQRTTGTTQFVFVLENGKMKLVNLRGNLIYATLSPEIAESSGLPSDVIDEIRDAMYERNPVQPGAGETVEAGDTTTSDIETGNITLTQTDAHPPMTNQAFVFRSRQVLDESDVALIDDTNGDFKRREGWLIVKAGNGVLDLGAVNINSVTEVPASGYASGPIGMAEGNVYAISISDGTYALIQVTGSNWGVWPFTTNYVYKYQRAQTRSFR